MKTDPAIQRTSDARQRISSSVGDDPAKIVEYYIQIKERFAARLRRGPGDSSEDEGMADHRHPGGRA